MIPTQTIEVVASRALPKQRALLYLVFAAALLRLLSLSLYPLTDMTEARYAEIARLMVELDDWVTPWFDYGIPFWGKPPLSVWLTAISFKLFGVVEFAARLPHWLSGLLVAWLVWGLAERRSANLALYAVILLYGSILFIVSAGFVMTDMVMLVGTTMAMRGFWCGLHGDESQRQRERWLFFVGLGIGLLAKGPIAFVLSVVPVGLWAIFTGNVGKTLRALPWFRGALITLAMAVPWYVLAEHRTPGFLNYFLVGEHWNRFMTPGWKGDLYGVAHVQRHGTIWLFLLVDLLPWALILPAYALWRHVGREPVSDTPTDKPWAVYLWLWALTPAVFFTFASNILWPYVLPGFPALMLLAAGWLETDPDARRVNRLLAFGLVVMILALSGVIAGIHLSGMTEQKSQKALVADYEASRKADEALIYVGRREFSADFYSEGRARFVSGVDELMQQLGEAPVYIAVKNEQVSALPPELVRSMTQVGRRGRYTLLLYSDAR